MNTSKLLLGLSFSTIPLALTGQTPASTSAEAHVPLATPESAAGARFWWSDFDGDGHSDAFAIARSGEPRLLKNRADGTLQDVTRSAGLATVERAHAAAWNDLDGDGQIDLAVGGERGARLFRNLGDESFEEISAGSGIQPNGPVRQVAWIDFDDDGRADLFASTDAGDTLHRNLGDGIFEEVELHLPALPSQTPGVPVTEGTRPGGADEAPAPSEEERDDDGSRAPGGVERTAIRIPNRPPIEDSRVPIDCPDAVRDQGTGACLSASSLPTLGMLYPISGDLFVAPDGDVGIGTTNPVAKFHVVGDTFANGPAHFTGSVRAGHGFFTNEDSTFGGSVSSTLFIGPLATFDVDCQGNIRSDSIEADALQSDTIRGGVVRSDTDVIAAGEVSGTTLVASDQVQTSHVVATGNAVITGQIVAANSQFHVTATGRTVTKELMITGGADLVEGFESAGEACEPGTVVVIDSEHAGMVTASSEAYDTKVAGVVSGANGVQHGLRMGQDGALDGDTLVAMTGRVWVRASAENGVVVPGDLLTTASLAGHAMKATDLERRSGSRPFW